MTNTRLHRLFAVTLVGALSFSSVACHKEGPAERAGKKLDEAATDVGNAVEDKCEKAKEGLGAKDTNC
jgi:hypothetical protein